MTLRPGSNGSAPGRGQRVDPGRRAAEPGPVCFRWLAPKADRELKGCFDAEHPGGWRRNPQGGNSPERETRSRQAEAKEGESKLQKIEHAMKREAGSEDGDAFEWFTGCGGRDRTGACRGCPHV